MSESLRVAAGRMAERVAAWRRHLHAHPELSSHEEQTARFVAAELRRLGYEPRERVGGGFGITADLHVDDRPAVALRADMDALPIHEATGVEYASTNPGVMHACGHDAHMAMLLGAAQLLAERRDQLKRSVRLVFQPAEEADGGATGMIAGGALEGVGAIYGLHVWADMPIGTLGTRAGAFMAGTNPVRITIHGRGGHAAMPHQCIDPVVIAAQVILGLQTVVSRGLAMTDSAVVSITCVQAGTASNIIPATAELRGTIRTLDERTRATVLDRVRQIAGGIVQAHGATADVVLEDGNAVLVNDAGLVKRVFDLAREQGFPEERLLTMPPQGGAEDFAFYARQVPAAFVFLGARNEAKGCCYPHHHPHFNIDEDALPAGTALLAGLALAGLDD